VTGTFYEILGVHPQASAEEIKHAYRLLARKYHPDANNPHASETLFRKVSEAYSTLSSAKRRLKYDEQLGIAPQGEFTRKTATSIFDRPEIDPNHERPNHEVTGEAKSEKKPSGSHQREREAAEKEATRKAIARKETGLFDRLGRILGQKRNDVPLRECEGETKRQNESPQGFNRGSKSEDLRGERFFHFTIDGLESMMGTTREIAIKSDSTPRLLRVRVPPGSCDGDKLKVHTTEDGDAVTYTVKISIVPHEYVSRDGRDVLLRVPLTMGETLGGVELQVPTFESQAVVTVPPGWDIRKKMRLKGLGVRRGDSGGEGDLYLEFFIVPPDRKVPQAEHLAKLLDESYSAQPRAHFPKNF